MTCGNSWIGKLRNIINTLLFKMTPFPFPVYLRKKQDIEIAGFFAAVFSWGNRTTIIQQEQGN
jgi:hypothetical protein